MNCFVYVILPCPPLLNVMYNLLCPYLRLSLLPSLSVS